MNTPSPYTSKKCVHYCNNNLQYDKMAKERENFSRQILTAEVLTCMHDLQKAVVQL